MIQEPITDEPQVSPPAPFGLRLLAKLTDVLVVNVAEVLLLCAFPILQALGMSGVLLATWLIGLLVVFSVGYFTALTSGGRRTLGYRLAGLLVVRDVPPGQSPALGSRRALGRSLLDLVCLVLVQYGVGLLDYLPVAVTRQKRALHDLAAGTRVVRVGTPRYPALALCAVGFIAVPVAGVFGVIRPFLMQAFYMPSPSMTPTLPVNSRFLVNKVTYRVHTPRRGDMVAFNIPASAASYFPGAVGSDIVKRIVGLPGDELRMTGGRVYLYNSGHPQALSESFVTEGYYGDLPEPGGTEGADDWFTRRRSALARHGDDWWIKVPTGQYFVLGDNRNDSNDSHIWGFLPAGDITGKVTFMYSPRIRDL